MPGSGLITVGSYSTPLEAMMACAVLESCGIEAMLDDFHAISANWLWSNALGGIKVQVAPEQAAEASGILAAAPDELPAEEAADAEHPVCPNCGGVHTHRFIDKRAAFATWLLLGFPIIPVFPKHVCGDCGNMWRD